MSRATLLNSTCYSIVDIYNHSNTSKTFATSRKGKPQNFIDHNLPYNAQYFLLKEKFTTVQAVNNEW